MVQCKWSRLFQSTFETKDHWGGNENKALRETHFHFSRYSAVEKLVEKYGSTLNVAKDDGFTTLHIAAINGYREIAMILLEQVITSAYNFSICLSRRILKQFTTLRGNSRSFPFFVYLLFRRVLFFIFFAKPLRLIEREMPKTSIKCMNLVHFDDSSFSFSPAVVSMQWQVKIRLLFIWPLRRAIQIWRRSF